MPRSLTRFLLTVCAACAALAHPASATLYQPDDPTAVPVSETGTPEPLPFLQFKRKLVDLRNEAIPELRTAERERLLGFIKTREAAKSPTTDESATLAADLLRAGRFDQAVNLLKPLYDDRERKGTRTYIVTSTLVHAHALRGEWEQALLGYYPDLLDLKPPPAVPKLTPAQWKWQLGLDRRLLGAYLRAHRQLAARATDSARRHELDAAEDVFPLFPDVRFVNDAGKYEPGKLAAAERAKLPPDAVAAVQQFLFWFPEDTHLYWLLGELYAADGHFADARQILKECADARRFGNRKVLMAHREAVSAAAEKAEADAKTKAEAEERAQAEADAKAKEDAAQAVPISLRTVWIYFGVVAAVAAVAAARVIARRVRGGPCGPVG